MSNFYATEIEFWAGLQYWKNIGPIMSNFWWRLTCFYSQKTIQNFFENIVASKLESEGEKKS